MSECICEDWFAEGEAQHLPDCPRSEWTCRCRHVNRPVPYGSIAPGECGNCGAQRRSSTPEGW